MERETSGSKWSIYMPSKDKDESFRSIASSFGQTFSKSPQPFCLFITNLCSSNPPPRLLLCLTFSKIFCRNFIILSAKWLGFEFRKWEGCTHWDILWGTPVHHLGKANISSAKCGLRWSVEGQTRIRMGKKRWFRDCDRYCQTGWFNPLPTGTLKKLKKLII